MSEEPSYPPRPQKKSLLAGTRWTWIAISLFILATVLGLNARKIYHGWLDYRSDGAVAKATRLKEGGDYGAAIEAAAGALHKTPNHPGLIRFTAGLLSKEAKDHATAAVLLRRLLATPDATAEDRLSLLECLVRMGDLAGAKEHLAELPADLKEQRRGLEALSAIAALQGDMTGAETLLRRALMKEPDNPECQLRLAILDENQAFESVRPAITDRIWKVARGKDETALAAILHLAGSLYTAPRQADELLELVKAHPKAGDSERYTVLSACHRLNPLDTALHVEEEMKRQKGKSPQTLGDFFQWLGSVGHHQKILELMPKDAALRDSRSMLIYIDALAAAGQWQPLIDLMQQSKLPISLATRNLVLGQSYARQERNGLQQAARFLQESLAAAGPGDQAILMRVAASADSIGLTGVAREAYTKLLGLRPERRAQVLEKLLDLCRRERDTKGMLDTLKELQLARPGFEPDVERLMYVRLLSGMEMELALHWMQNRSDTAADTEDTVLSALAAHRIGNVEHWRNATSAIRHPERLEPGMRGVVAGFLAMNGDKTAAFRLVETLSGSLADGQVVGDKRGLLLPEELRLMEAVVP